MSEAKIIQKNNVPGSKPAKIQSDQAGNYRVLFEGLLVFRHNIGSFQTIPRVYLRVAEAKIIQKITSQGSKLAKIQSDQIEFWLV